jgi:hypothetical protein
VQDDALGANAAGTWLLLVTAYQRIHSVAWVAVRERLPDEATRSNESEGAAAKRLTQALAVAKDQVSSFVGCRLHCFTEPPEGRFPSDKVKAVRRSPIQTRRCQNVREIRIMRQPSSVAKPPSENFRSRALLTDKVDGFGRICPTTCGKARITILAVNASTAREWKVSFMLVFQRESAFAPSKKNSQFAGKPSRSLDPPFTLH